MKTAWHFINFDRLTGNGKPGELLRKTINNLFWSGTEILSCVFVLCLASPWWENKGLFPSPAGTVVNLLLLAGVGGGVVHSVICLARSLQSYNEYRYERKYENADPSEK